MKNWIAKTAVIAATALGMMSCQTKQEKSLEAQRDSIVFKASDAFIDMINHAGGGNSDYSKVSDALGKKFNTAAVKVDGYLMPDPTEKTGYRAIVTARDTLGGKSQINGNNFKQF